MADSDYVPVGAIVPLGRTLPAQSANFMLCDGSELDATAYAELYDAIGTTYGGNTDTKTFKLPDLRGYFPRGADHGSGNDPNASTRIRANGSFAEASGVGTYQNFATRRPDNAFKSDIQLQSSTTRQHGETKGGVMKEGSDQRITTCNDGGGNPDTRPINVYVEYYIKARS